MDKDILEPEKKKKEKKQIIPMLELDNACVLKSKSCEINFYSFCNMFRNL